MIKLQMGMVAARKLMASKRGLKAKCNRAILATVVPPQAKHAVDACRAWLAAGQQ